MKGKMGLTVCIFRIDNIAAFRNFVVAFALFCADWLPAECDFVGFEYSIPCINFMECADFSIRMRSTLAGDKVCATNDDGTSRRITALIVRLGPRRKAISRCEDSARNDGNHGYLTGVGLGRLNRPAR